jgi:hypothetical protein
VSPTGTNRQFSQETLYRITGSCSRAYKQSENQLIPTILHDANNANNSDNGDNMNNSKDSNNDNNYHFQDLHLFPASTRGNNQTSSTLCWFVLRLRTGANPSIPNRIQRDHKCGCIAAASLPYRRTTAWPHQWCRAVPPRLLRRTVSRRHRTAAWLQPR